MSDAQAQGHVRALERMGYRVTLDFSERPWIEAASHAWCRKCKARPLIRHTLDGKTIIYCEGRYDSQPRGYIHTARSLYDMHGVKSCHGSPCDCIERCQGWEVEWTQ